MRGEAWEAMGRETRAGPQGPETSGARDANRYGAVKRNTAFQLGRKIGKVVGGVGGFRQQVA